RTFIDLFEEQVLKTPERVAISHAGRRISYAELNEGADRLAQRLHTHGVGPETIVAVMAERGVNTLTAILAIFKVGGAYLPLDPQHPAERVAQVLSKSRSALVLLEGEFEQALSQAFEKMEATPIAMRFDETTRHVASVSLPTRENLPAS